MKNRVRDEDLARASAGDSDAHDKVLDAATLNSAVYELQASTVYFDDKSEWVDKTADLYGRKKPAGTPVALSGGAKPGATPVATAKPPGKK